MTGEEFSQSLHDEVLSQHASNADVRIPGADQSELPELVIRHWLQFAVYYEKAATAFIGGWMRTTNEPEAVVHFAHQIEDEANHYSWLREHLIATGGDPDAFTPPEEWRALMDDFYPGLEHLVERLAAHNIASEIGALGFMEFNLEKFPAPIRNTVERVCQDEKYHVAFGRKLLAQHCTTRELQARARQATRDALEWMRRGREVFVRV